MNEKLSICLVSSQHQFSLVTQSCLTLQPHGPEHARPPCPSPAPRVYPNSCSLSWWCRPTISSSVIPFSSFLQSFRASGSQSSFPTSERKSYSVSFPWPFPRMDSKLWVLPLFIASPLFFFFSQSSPRCEGILTALSLTLTSDLHMSFAPLIWNSFQNSNIFKSFCLNHLHWFLFPMWNNAHNLFSHLNCPLQCGSFQIFQAHIILQFNG